MKVSKNQIQNVSFSSNKEEIDEICDYFIADYYDMLEGKIEVEYELSSGK